MRGTIKWKRSANGTVGRRGRSSGHFGSGFGPRLTVDTIGFSSIPVAIGSHGGAGEAKASSRGFVRSGGGARSSSCLGVGGCAKAPRLHACPHAVQGRAGSLSA